MICLIVQVEKEKQQLFTRMHLCMIHACSVWYLLNPSGIASIHSSNYLLTATMRRASLLMSSYIKNWRLLSSLLEISVECAPKPLYNREPWTITYSLAGLYITSINHSKISHLWYLESKPLTTLEDRVRTLRFVSLCLNKQSSMKFYDIYVYIHTHRYIHGLYGWWMSMWLWPKKFWEPIIKVALTLESWLIILSCRFWIPITNIKQLSKTSLFW